MDEATWKKAELAFYRNVTVTRTGVIVGLRNGIKAAADVIRPVPVVGVPEPQSVWFNPTETLWNMLRSYVTIEARLLLCDDSTYRHILCGRANAQNVPMEEVHRLAQLRVYRLHGTDIHYVR